MVPGRPLQVDAGEVYPEEPISIYLEVENDTGDSLRFLRVDPACGCTSGRLPESAIPPGETVPLWLGFDMAGRIGPQSHLVVYEISRDGESEHQLMMIDVGLDLNADLILSRRRILLSYNPAHSGEGVVESSTISAVLSQSLLDRAPQRVEVTRLADSPEHLAIVTVDSPGDLLGAAFRMSSQRDRVASLPTEFSLPLRIGVMFGEDGSFEEYIRNLTVNVQAGFRLTAEPSDLFLGIVTDGNKLQELETTVSIEPTLPFELEETSGRVGGLVWEATPNAPSEERSQEWNVALRLEEPGGHGAHSVEIPLKVVCDGEGESWARVFTLNAQWISLP